MPAKVQAPASDGSFGLLLRSWREYRRLSQLKLALDADVSARHLSFLESGRANPSREMVLTLAEALEIPLREQNILLQAAGFAAIFRETHLTAPELAGVRTALELILRAHEPFGAMAMTHRWDVMMANRPQAMMLTPLVGRQVPAFQVLEAPRPNVLQLLFEPSGLRQMLANWEAVARETLHRARRDALWARDAHLEALVRDLTATLPPASDPPARTGTRGVGIPSEPQRAEKRAAALPPPDGGASAILPVEFRDQDTTLRLFSTLTTLGAPQDVTLQELRIEAFYPADRATERHAREMFNALLQSSSLTS